MALSYLQVVAMLGRQAMMIEALWRAAYMRRAKVLRRSQGAFGGSKGDGSGSESQQGLRLKELQS
jgi:hypothetical protein